MYFTDTFRNYAIVLDSAFGFVAINRQFHVLCNVFIFDNDPGDPSDELCEVAKSIGMVEEQVKQDESTPTLEV